jgi:hypothetical protein
MAFGMKSSSGSFRDIVKYDARAGRLFRVDRSPSGEREQTPLPVGTPFALDFGSMEVGYVSFGSMGPARTMVTYGQPIPGQPTDVDEKGRLIAKPGFFALIYNRDLGVREWCSNAGVLTEAVDALLLSSYVGSTEADQGLIPIICIADTKPVSSGRGANKSTNYAPVFELKQWIQRDTIPDLPPQSVFVGASRLRSPSTAAVLPKFADAPLPAAAPMAPMAPAPDAKPSAMPF